MRETYDGKIKWFNLEKGYGFILCLETKEDIFFHVEQFISQGFLIPKSGEDVVFQKFYSDKGIRAMNVYKKEAVEQ